MAEPAALLQTEIRHHGAVDGVTGSCHELCVIAGDTPVGGLLIDCGLFQGAEVSGRSGNAHTPQIDFPIDHLQAMVITHVHIDHCGRLPYLLAAGFKGPIYCSKPSALLLPLVIEDALKVGVTQDRSLIRAVLRQLKKQLVPLAYNQWQRVTDAPLGIQIRLQRAGHILGSAYVECRTGRGKHRRRIVFSGDLGASHTPLLPEPKPPIGCDELVIESTYGDRNHLDRAHRIENLRAVIQRALQNKGSVLIPAFSIGRTQELLYEIEQIIAEAERDHAGPDIRWSDLEIVLDSPLAAKFTKVYRQAAYYWDEEARERLENSRHPLDFEQLLTVSSHSDHLKIVDRLSTSDYPAIVLAASGMCSGGRIVNYLKALIENPLTDIVFVGYQARGTPGREIQQYGPSGGYVRIDDKNYDIKAGVYTVSGYSAHADQSDLIAFISGMLKRPERVRIVHGDNTAKITFKAKIKALAIPDVVIPYLENTD